MTSKKIVFISLVLFGTAGVLVASGEGVSARETFAVAGHVRSDENFTANPVLAVIADFAEREKIGALFLNGDSVYGAIREESTIEREWNAAREALGRFSGETYFVSGNHDFSTPELTRYWRDNIAEPFYAFTKAGIRFIVLDSTDLVSDTRSREEQLNFLRGELSSLPRKDPFFMLIHHALWLKPHDSDGRVMRLMANVRHGEDVERLWDSEIAPLLRGRRGIVASGDAGQHRIKYAYKKEDNILYLLNGIDANPQEENVFFVFTVENGDVQPYPVSVLAASRICGGLNPFYRTDILGFPLWGRIWNTALRFLPLSMCTPPSPVFSTVGGVGLFIIGAGVFVYRRRGRIILGSS